MRIITFSLTPNGGPRPGLWLDDGGVLDVQRAFHLAVTSGTLQAPPDMAEAFGSVHGIIAHGYTAQRVLFWMATAARSIAMAAARVAREDIRLLAPIPRPAKNIFCVGRNYVDHVKEGYVAQGLRVTLPEHIQLFSKPPTTVIGPGAGIPYDSKVTQKLDYEVELAVVIGKTGINISEADAYDHIFGYTIINDISARDLQRRHDQWFKGKGLDGSCPMGPWIVTADQIPDPQDLALSLSVNGEIRQQARTSQMIFNLRRIIADLSRGMTLEAGDVIATGTPSGVGYAMDPPGLLSAGDIVECEIEHIGTLVNPVIAV